MSDVEDFKTVIERRKGSLSHVLQQRVSKALYSYELSKVCEEIGDSSCFGRNWKKMATFLIKPDHFTMTKLSESEDKGFEVLSKWLEINEEGRFDELLQAMVECEVYSAADELLIFLERLESICVDEENHNEESTVGKKQFLTEKLESKSTSCQDSRPNNQVPDTKQDRIFIISSKEDSETLPMKKFLSFIRRLKRVKKGELHVSTIHDWPRGTMVTAWLEEQVKRAEYVLICCSQKVKEIVANSNTFISQSDSNLKYTLDILVTGELWRNMCYNRGGKFLPILMPGNSPSCIMQCFVVFRTYNWPNDQENIKKYLLNLPERQPSGSGKRKPLRSKQLPTQRVA